MTDQRLPSDRMLRRARWIEQKFLVDLRPFPIDAATVSIHNRRKRLLVADMDSTMIQQECIDELGVVAGVGDHIKAITARSMRGPKCSSSMGTGSSASARSPTSRTLAPCTSSVGPSM